jgi:hypothetical protein
LTQGALQSTKIIAESLKKVSGARLETEHLTSPSLHGGAADQGLSDRS